MHCGCNAVRALNHCTTVFEGLRTAPGPGKKRHVTTRSDECGAKVAAPAVLTAKFSPFHEGCKIGPEGRRTQS
ncbi:hypothetical protein GCM10010289_13090 [Streptomyces violascens]|nr:hypothetical protein GCM10010289_13090 [Streptomyces violascens]